MLEYITPHTTEFMRLLIMQKKKIVMIAQTIIF